MLHLLSPCLSKLNYRNSFKFFLGYYVFLEICEPFLDSLQLIYVLQQPRADCSWYPIRELSNSRKKQGSLVLFHTIDDSMDVFSFSY